MKQISISNLAWPAESDEEAIDLAISEGFEGIEIAPFKVFGTWCDDEIVVKANAYRARLAEKEVVIPALQAIVFGAEDCHLFRSNETRRNLATHLGKTARLAGLLEAQACVFGAPKLRDPGSLTRAQAMTIAVDFFSEIAGLFESEGASLAFEANAVQYDCRFITHTFEAVDLVRFVDHPGVRLQLDTGTMFQMQEELESIIKAVPFAAHFHASEASLAPVGSVGSNHAAVADALIKGSYNHWKSVEMRPTDDWRGNIRRAAHVMKSTYLS